MNDEELKIAVAVVKDQTRTTQDTLSAVEERQRGIATSVIRLEAGHNTIVETLARMEKRLEELDSQHEQVAAHEIRLDNLDTGIKWGGGIAASLLGAAFLKLFGLH